MTHDLGTVHASLRHWAAGIRSLEGAVELLISAHGGRWSRPDHAPWVRQDSVSGRWWIDADLLEQAGRDGTRSGGERRLLSLAAALAGGDQPTYLLDAITLDEPTGEAVIAALRHAMSLPPVPQPPYAAECAPGQHRERQQ